MKEKLNMKYLIPILLSLAFALTGCSNNSKGDSYKQISMDEAMQMMEAEDDYVILDVRTKDEYKEGHIPGAICVPNETIGEDAVAELPEKEQIILVYCRSGNRSKKAAAKLSAQGYTKVYEFGGILDWQGTIVLDDE